MAKNETSLTEMQVRNAKPKEKPYKLFDGGGLYLEVATSGSRIWRLKFRQADGKENRLTFGPYPEITLQEAREKRLEARRLMLKGIDPAKHRDDAKRLAAEQFAHNLAFHTTCLNFTPIEVDQRMGVFDEARKPRKIVELRRAGSVK